MAQPAVKMTFSLDLATAEEIERLARRWNVPKVEAVRRAIRSASFRQPSRRERRMQALNER